MKVALNAQKIKKAVSWGSIGPINPIEGEGWGMKSTDFLFFSKMVSVTFKVTQFNNQIYKIFVQKSKF